MLVTGIGVGRHLEIVWVTTVVVPQIEEHGFLVTLAVKKQLDELIQFTPLLRLLLLNFFCFFLWSVFHLCHGFFLGGALRRGIGSGAWDGRE